MKLPLTPSQTVGPFFSIGLNHLNAETTFFHGVDQAPSADADGLTVEGRIIDSNGVPVPDAFLEIWHAPPDGIYLQDTSTKKSARYIGFTRVAASADGTFRFTTMKPGQVAYDAERVQAPHLLILLFMRGLLRNLVTRMYFPDESANESDPVLLLVPADRRTTLIAQSTGPGQLQWDVFLRAASDKSTETVFFAW